MSETEKTLEEMAALGRRETLALLQHAPSMALAIRALLKYHGPEGITEESFSGRVFRSCCGVDNRQPHEADCTWMALRASLPPELRP